MNQATAAVSVSVLEGNLPDYAMGRGLRCLAILNEWERVHMPFIKSTSGRDLYFLLVKHFVLVSEAEAVMPLKSFSVSLSDKAMRQRMQEFEQLGLVTVHTCPSDTRIKHLHPTPQLHALFDAHNQIMRRCFRHYFHYVKKDDAVPLMDYRELFQPTRVPPPV